MAADSWNFIMNSGMFPEGDSDVCTASMDPHDMTSSSQGCSFSYHPASVCATNSIFNYTLENLQATEESSHDEGKPFHEPPQEDLTAATTPLHPDFLNTSQVLEGEFSQMITPYNCTMDPGYPTLMSPWSEFDYTQGSEELIPCYIEERSPKVICLPPDEEEISILEPTRINEVEPPNKCETPFQISFLKSIESEGTTTTPSFEQCFDPSWDLETLIPNHHVNISDKKLLKQVSKGQKKKEERASKAIKRASIARKAKESTFSQYFIKEEGYGMESSDSNEEDNDVPWTPYGHLKKRL